MENNQTILKVCELTVRYWNLDAYIKQLEGVLQSLSENKPINVMDASKVWHNSISIESTDYAYDKLKEVLTAKLEVYVKEQKQIANTFSTLN